MRGLVFLSTHDLQPQELYIYYRTQHELLEAAAERLESLKNASLIEVFDDEEALQKTLQLYTELAANTKQKLDEMIASNYELLERFNALAARIAVDAQQIETLDSLNENENEIITDKLYIMLHRELRRD